MASKNSLPPRCDESDSFFSSQKFLAVFDSRRLDVIFGCQLIDRFLEEISVPFALEGSWYTPNLQLSIESVFAARDLLNLLVEIFFGRF